MSTFTILPGVAASIGGILAPSITKPPVPFNVFNERPGAGVDLIRNAPLVNAPAPTYTTLKNTGPKSATMATFGYTHP